MSVGFFKNRAALSAAAILIGFAAQLASVQAQEAPIYEPLPDRDARGFREAKYQKDLAFCRQRAAPQEQAVRAGSQQAGAGAVLGTAGAIASGLPVPGFNAARGLFAGGQAAQATGAAIGDQGAATAGAAMQDYILVVTSCLGRRGYVLLR